MLWPHWGKHPEITPKDLCQSRSWQDTSEYLRMTSTCVVLPIAYCLDSSVAAVIVIGGAAGPEVELLPFQRHAGNQPTFRQNEDAHAVVEIAGASGARLDEGCLRVRAKLDAVVGHPIESALIL